MTQDSRPDPTAGSLFDPRSQFAVVLSQVRDYAIFTMDTAGRPRSWNGGVRRILGFEEAEFVGADVIPIIFTPEAVASGIPELEFEQATLTGHANDDRWMRRKDGSLFFAAGATTVIRSESGEVAGFLKIMRDRTQWMNSQIELQRRMDELAKVDQERNAFIAVLAHELRNPLAPLGNVAQVLKRRARDPAQVQSMAALVERQVAQMSQLIADLLDVSRITHGKIELDRKPVAVSSIVQQALEVVRPQEESLRHNVEVIGSPEPLHVHGDANRLVQVLVNLLANAYKFTPPGGRIWVTTERESDQVTLRVRDDGIGIPLADQSRVFEMFTQIDSSKDRARGGLGIGLSLVRKLVELHGGTVDLYSAGRGTGTEFTVRLPRHVEGTTAQASRPTDTPAGKHMRRILVVDDNVDAAFSLAALLELDGHHASIANSGDAALRLAESEKPEVVILDIGMPGMSGLQVAQHLRRLQRDPAPVLIALTGWGQPEDRQLTAESGFDHHLVKPVDPAALQAIVNAPASPGNHE
ncbi:MAG TPA: ATP-binding protein [Steroidobacteraceae bacterium]|nr:ATP-binding protein [Steroidobacteraceae bacterium]